MKKKLSVAVALVALVGLVAQGSTEGYATKLITTLFAFLVITLHVVFAIVTARCAKRLGRDSVAWGLLAGFVSPALMAIILATIGGKKGAVSCVIELDSGHKKALEERFQSLRMDLANGIRFVVYKWLGDQKKSES
jgi:hypothetical protein